MKVETHSSSWGKAYLAGAFMLAGTSVITGRVLGNHLDAFTIQAVSLGMMLVVLLPIYGSRIRHTARGMKKDQWMAILLQAFFGMFAFRCLLLFGLPLTSAGEAGVLLGTAPAITALLARMVLKEPLYQGAVQGILCTVAGLALIQGAGGSFSWSHTAGNLLVLCAAASESLFNLLAKKRQSLDTDRNNELHPMVQTFLVSAAAFLFSLLPALLEQPVEQLAACGPLEWTALIWYGLIVTAVSYALFYRGVKRCDPYVTAAFSGVAPLVSMLLAVWLLREPLGLQQWLGGGLVVLGIGLIGGRAAGKLMVRAKA
ncbi:MAG: hypothetical protein K0Q90_4457 [Paenibacillaceae bacterium]|nr:hypothetical protein [Paenibacillaceae bacterium]